MADVRLRLLRRYYRIMGLVMLGVLAAAALMAWREVGEQLRLRQSLASGRMAEQAIEIDSLLRVSVNGVRALTALADLRFRTLATGQVPSPLLAALLASRQGTRVSLDHPPEPWTRADIGNLTGELDAADLGDPALAAELEMALALNSTLVAVLTNNPSAVSAYYQSARRFINIVPWLPSSGFAWSPIQNDHEYFRLVLPEANPSRAPVWTGAYLDDAGKGLMVTAAMPVYEGDRFRGVAALDVTLHMLSRSVRVWPTVERGTLLLVDRRGQVLANSDHALGDGATATPTLATILPGPLRGHAAALAAGQGAALVEREGYYVASTPMTHGPFTLVLVMSKSDLVGLAVRNAIGFVLGLALGLSILLITASWLVRREFIAPAQALVNFIEEESRGPALGRPEVHPAWQPWFDTIRRIFGAHTQLVSLRQELDVARRMQQSILPTRFPERPDVQVSARMVPAKEVGGDFYDYFWLDERRIGLVVADVSDKGVPAALFMAVSRTLLRATAAVSDGPAHCLSQTNSLLAQENDQLTFVTVFYGVLDTATGVLRYASGGHLPPMLRRPDGRVEALAAVDGIALGVEAGAGYGEASCRLERGAVLLMVSDGVTEAFDAGSEEFGEARLAEVLRREGAEGAAPLVRAVVAAVTDFAKGVPQADDITCLALRFSRDPGTG